MDAWKMVLDERAFQTFVSSRAPERRKLLASFKHLRENPHRQPDYYAADSTGRKLNIWADRPFLITYWLDSFVSEVRIVNIERVRF